MGKSTNVTWHASDVTRADREKVLGQRGCTVWMTGLSGSGKSTVAVAAERMLLQQGRAVYRLDGDNVRHGLCGDLGFSADDREENNRRIGEVTKLFADAGLIVFNSFVSPFRATRAMIRKLHEDAGLPFLEVYVDVPLEVAEQRDPKGLYRKARAGEIADFTGISSPFEAPERPEVVLKTAEHAVDQCAEQLVAALRARGVVQTP